MSPVSLRKTTRNLHALRALCLTFIALAVAASAAHAQTRIGGGGVGANRGDTAGTGGSSSILGRIISPTGKMPDTRVRITLEHTDTGTRNAVAGDDGTFNFNNLEDGSYTLTIDAGSEYEIARENVYIEGGKPTYNVPVYLRLKPEANPALAGVPKPALELFKKAVEAGQKNDNDKAMSLLNEAIAQHPQFALAHNELGLLYLKTGQLDKSLEEFKTAQKTLPDDPQIQYNYGLALLEKKDFTEAEKQFRKSVKKLDKSPQAHMYLGVAVMRQKTADQAERQRLLGEAQKEFQQSIKLGGDPAGRVHYYLGGVYWGQGELKKAADELELYVKQSPKAPDAEQVRGTIKELRSKS
jgi:tetratricopeptide (TPR) repeat protein